MMHVRVEELQRDLSASLQRAKRRRRSLLDALGNLWPYEALLLTASSRCSYIAPTSGREALEQRAAPRLARNNNMRLVEPAEQWRAAFLDMASEYSAAGDHRYDMALHDFGAYLRRIAEGRCTEGLPPGRVPGTECWLEEAGRIVACVCLRFWLTPELEREGGHVGYDVRPSMRRCGYGTALLRLVLPLVCQHGIQRVRMTCDADNSGSRKIIERNGGILAGEEISHDSGKLIRQYWIDP